MGLLVQEGEPSVSGDANPLIQNNLIAYNQGRYGGGIVLNYSGATIRNNIIDHNSGGEDYGGGGIWSVGASAQNQKYFKIIPLQIITLIQTEAVSGSGTLLPRFPIQ